MGKGRAHFVCKTGLRDWRSWAFSSLLPPSQWAQSHLPRQAVSGAAGSQCQGRKGWARWPDGPASPLVPSQAGSHSEGILPSRGPPPNLPLSQTHGCCHSIYWVPGPHWGQGLHSASGSVLYPGRKLSPGRRINSNPGRTGLGDQQGGHRGQPALFSGTEGPSQE